MGNSNCLWTWLTPSSVTGWKTRVVAQQSTPKWMQISRLLKQLSVPLRLFALLSQKRIPTYWPYYVTMELKIRRASSYSSANKATRPKCVEYRFSDDYLGILIILSVWVSTLLTHLRGVIQRYDLTSSWNKDGILKTVEKLVTFPVFSWPRCNKGGNSPQ